MTEHEARHVETVLVVDDMPENLLVLKGVLTDHYRIKVATSGAKAIEIATATLPDLILLDIMMPDMDGYEVCRRLKQSSITREIPVIFVTALNETLHEEMGFAAGCVDYITKPISPAITLARVRTHLELRRAGLILAQEQVMAAQKEALENLTTVANGIPALIAHVDAQERYLYVNRAYAEWVGFPEEQIIGKGTAEILPEAVYQDAATSVSRVLRGQPCFLERRAVVGGRELVHLVNYVPQLHPNGTVRSYFELVTDLTELRQLSEQLLHSQKMEAIGQLAGGVAHDFNNILSVISGYCQLMQMEMAPDAPCRPDLEQVIDATARASQLTQALLAFGRKEKLALQPVDLNPVLSRTEQFLRRVIGEDIRISVMLPDTPVIVLADSGQIDQVIINLATNARDAMPDGGTFSLSLAPCYLDQDAALQYGCPSGKYAEITATDSGHGMSIETQHKIFEPFFTTKELGKGTGLGLSIVYGIVKQHNGTIQVSSNPGQGTCFRLLLPLHEHSAEVPLHDSRHTPLHGNETILVVEDDATIRGILERVLGLFGYTMIVVSNGREAVETFEQWGPRIDLVVLDVLMPAMNGKDAADLIRQMRPDVAMFFVSGYTADILQSRGILEDQYDIFMKPINPTRFLEKIREVLDRKPA